MEKKKIQLIKFIELRYADPISSIDLTDEYLLYGTMLGATKFYIINDQKLICLSDTQDEFISGVKINENKLYICIGDVKIYQYYVGNEEEKRSPDFEIKNYESEEQHEKKCENCLSMFNNNYLIRNYIDYSSSKQKEENEEEEEKHSNNNKNAVVSFKNIFDNDNRKIIEREIKMSEYSVPFDFDGKNFIFIEFTSQNHRTFHVYDVDAQEMKTNIEIEQISNEHIGHISHLKIINDDLLFIVRDYNVCEVRNFKLEIQKKLNIKASEILAFDILYGEKIEENKSDVNTDVNKNNDEEILYIVLLDIDCNVFLYNYKEDKNELLINLDKDEIGIDKDIKGQGFFLLNYPYYIKISKKYIAISSDYGCILIQYNES
jgi:hypothetical protein